MTELIVVQTPIDRINATRLEDWNADRIRTAGDLATLAILAETVGLTEQVTEARERLEHLASGAFVVAIIGEFKRGKSTLANALLGAEVMPSDVLPATASINRVVFGRAPRVLLCYQDGSQEAIEISALGGYVTKLTDESAARAARLHEAIIEYPTLLCRQNVQLVDTPGLGDEAAMTERTQRAIESADAAILVTSATAPFSKSEAELLRHLVKRVDPSRLFFVLNHIDLFSESDVTRIAEAVATRIRIALGNPEVPIRLFPVSARGGVIAKRTRNASSLTDSRLEALEQELERFLVRDRGIASLQIANEYTVTLGETIANEASRQLQIAEQNMHIAMKRHVDLEERLSRLAADAEAFQATFEQRCEAALASVTVAVKDLVMTLTQRTHLNLRRIRFTEQEVAEPAVRHWRVEQAVAPELRAELERTATKSVHGLRIWTGEELLAFEALIRRLDDLLGEREAVLGSDEGAKSDMPRDLRQARVRLVQVLGARQGATNVLSAQSALSLGEAFAGDMVDAVAGFPAEFQIPYAPDSFSGSMRSLMGEIVSTNAVKSSMRWFRDANVAKAAERQRVANLAANLWKDYDAHLAGAIKRINDSVQPLRRLEAAKQTISEKLRVKMETETALIAKLVEKRIWELRIEQERVRGERLREMERVKITREYATLATAAAQARFSALTRALAESAAEEETLVEDAEVHETPPAMHSYNPCNNNNR